MTTSLPTISIITPSFNQARYLERTILSVLSQDYPKVEYMIIDGGSMDGSGDIIKNYSSKLEYWVSEKDSGQSHAINKGLARASGDILAYLNSDDFYLQNALGLIADSFTSDPGLDLVYGSCQIVDAEGKTIGHRRGSISRYDQILDLWGVWWRQKNFVQPEVFWSRKITERIGLFREDLYWVMDYEYWLRIFKAGGCVRSLDHELAAFRVHDLQKSKQPEKTAA